MVGRREPSFPGAVDWKWLCTRWLGRTSASTPGVPRALHRTSASANLLSRAWSLRLENRLGGVLLDPGLGPSSLPSVLEEVREEPLMPSEQGFLNLNEPVGHLGMMSNRSRGGVRDSDFLTSVLVMLVLLIGNTLGLKDLEISHPRGGH